MENLSQTLTITLWGMGLTFAAIGLLVVAMMLLTRWTRGEQPRPEAEASEEEALSAEELADMEQAAAAAVAMALAVAGRRAHPTYAWHSSRAEEEPSAWQAYARHQQLEQYKTHQSLRW